MDKALNKDPGRTFLLMIFIAIVFMGQAFAVSEYKSQGQVNVPVVKTKQQKHKEVVVLIHGLMRTYWSMKPLKLYLESQDYQVYYYSYPSAKYTIPEHGLYLSEFIRRVLANNPDVKIHFITHSIGGIILREALPKLNKKQLKNIGYVIMLAPPNQGSFLAKLSTKMFPMVASKIKPLAELSSDPNSYVHHVPVPKIKMGIIAGRFDAKVPPSSARLQGQPDPAIVNSTHTFIMNNSKTRKLIMTFLAKGTFNE